MPHTCCGFVPTGAVTGTGRWCWCGGHWGKRGIFPVVGSCLTAQAEMVSAVVVSEDQVRDVRRRETNGMVGHTADW